MNESLILELAVVVVTAAVLAVAADALRQPIIVAYVVAGFLFGPHAPWPALQLVKHPDFVEGAGELGLMLLLFLLGCVLHPDRLLQMFRRASLVTLGTSALFFAVGAGAAAIAGLLLPAVYPLDGRDAFYIGCAAAFSSTLLVVKLLPTRRLHDSPVGTLAIGVLILQDVLAIGLLIVMSARTSADPNGASLYWRAAAGVVMLAAAFPVEQFGLRRLMRWAEPYSELLFVLSLAWCFLLAEGARAFGFSREIGAFVAGLTIARSPVSLYIWDRVSPLRDFFIVLLFFSLGGRVNVADALPVLPLAAGLAVALALLKPPVFRAAFRLTRAPADLAREAGWRLGQSSEFALVIGLLALRQNQIGRFTFEVILVTTLASLVISTYLVVLKYPTPVGISERLRQD